MFNPKVTIIIPVYNWSNYLWEAIESALIQTYSNIEILVINDGSNDKWATEKIALSFGNKINYIYKENWWVATALNLWIEKANWEYISWLSHDDLYYTNKIEEAVLLLNKLDWKNIIFNDYELINENDKIINILKSPTNKEDIFFKLISNKFVFNWCTLLIPKKAFLEIWFFDYNLKTTQDYKMWVDMIKWWYSFINLPIVLTKYRIHDNQDSIKKKEMFNKEIKDTQKYVINNFNLNELKNKSWFKYNKYLFYIYLKSIYVKQNILWNITIITQKIWIYKIISPIYRKIFVK